MAGAPNFPDLASDHFDSLAVVGLLPGKLLPRARRGRLPTEFAQALCNFEGLTEHSLTGKLDEVKNEIAYFSIGGTATGVDLGAQVKMEVTAQGQFDLKSKRLVALEWRQKDQRDAGPVSPAATMTTINTLKRAAIEQPEKLSDVALVSVPDNFTPSALLTQLELRDAKDRYELFHPREWHVVSVTENHQVLRLMDHGDFIAQVTITPWTPAEKGKHLSPDDFRSAMYGAPNFELQKELQASEVPSEQKDRWIYRLSGAWGELDGVDAMQNFYLLAGPNGEQACRDLHDDAEHKRT